MGLHEAADNGVNQARNSSNFSRNFIPVTKSSYFFFFAVLFALLDSSSEHSAAVVTSKASHSSRLSVVNKMYMASGH